MHEQATNEGSNSKVCFLCLATLISIDTFILHTSNRWSISSVCLYFCLLSLTSSLSPVFSLLFSSYMSSHRSLPLSLSILSSLSVLPSGLIVVVMAGVWGAAWVQFHSGLSHTMCTIGAWSINTVSPVAMLIPAGPSLALCPLPTPLQFFCP